MDHVLSQFFQAPQIWMALALVLMIAELILGTTYLLWPSAAALFTALVASLHAPLPLQIVVFAALTIALVMFARPIVRNRMLQKTDKPSLNDRAKALVGVRAPATEAFVDGVGAVKINDSIWRAKSTDVIEAGATVEVLSVDGVTLTVAKA